MLSATLLDAFPIQVRRLSATLLQHGVITMTEKTKVVVKRDAKGYWQPGQSGNPNGRPPGTHPVTQLRNMISVHIPEIVDAMVKAAKEGDAQAAKLLLERVVPTLKPVSEPIFIPELKNKSLEDQGEVIVQAVASGKLTPSQGNQLLMSISSMMTVKEGYESSNHTRQRMKDLDLF